MAAQTTNIPGNYIKGNSATILLEGSFMKYLNGVGIDKTAMIMMFNSNNNPMILYTIAAFFHQEIRLTIIIPVTIPSNPAMIS